VLLIDSIYPWLATTSQRPSVLFVPHNLAGFATLSGLPVYMQGWFTKAIEDKTETLKVTVVKED